MHVDFVVSDSGSKIVLTCKDRDSGNVIPLTGATVKLKYQIDGAPLVTRAMTITNAAGGVAEYLFTVSEFARGTLECEFEIIDSGGLQLTSVDTFSFNIRKKLGT